MGKNMRYGAKPLQEKTKSRRYRRRKKELNMERKLNLDDLDKVAGGAGGDVGPLEELVTQIRRDHHAKELIELFRTQSGPAAYSKCCEYYPELCKYAASAVKMIEANSR